MSKMSESLPYCDICSKSFDNNSRKPLMLACGHTNCHTCLNIIFNASSSPVCPDCRQHFVFKSMNEIPANFYLLRQINKHLSEVQSKSLDKVEIKEIQDPCKKHKGETLDKWCKSCEKWSCTFCVSSEHQKTTSKIKCHIISKQEAIEKKIDRHWKTKQLISTKINAIYPKFYEAEEHLLEDLSLLKIELKNAIKKVEEINIKITKNDENRKKNSSRKIEMRSSESSMADITSKLDPERSISEFQEKETKLQENFQAAQEFIENMEVEFEDSKLQMINPNCEALIQTDSNNQLEIQQHHGDGELKNKAISIKGEVENLEEKINDQLEEESEVLQKKSILDTCKDQITILRVDFEDKIDSLKEECSKYKAEFEQLSVQLASITTDNEGFSETIREHSSEIKNLMESEMTVKEAIEDHNKQNQVLRDEKSIIEQNMQQLELKVKTESEARKQVNDEHAVILFNEKEKYGELQKQANLTETSLKELNDKLEHLSQKQSKELSATNHMQEDDDDEAFRLFHGT